MSQDYKTSIARSPSQSNGVENRIQILKRRRTADLTSVKIVDGVSVLVEDSEAR